MVTEESLLAVVAVAAGRIVSAVYTDATRLATRQFEQFHVEATSPGMEVAVAGCWTLEMNGTGRGSLITGHLWHWGVKFKCMQVHVQMWVQVRVDVWTLVLFSPFSPFLSKLKNDTV